MFEYFRSDENIARIKAQDTATQEKLIEALLLVMYADGIVKLSEKGELEKILDSIPWKEDLRYRGAFGGIMAKVRDAVDDESKAAPIITGIRGLDDSAHQFVIAACESMAEADGHADTAETSMIGRLRK